MHIIPCFLHCFLPSHSMHSHLRLLQHRLYCISAKGPIPFQMVDSLPAMTSTFYNRVGGGVNWLAQTLLWNLWLVCWLCGAVWCCVVRVVCCCMINRLAYISEYASFDHLNSRSSFNSDEACSWRHSHGDSWNEVCGGLSRTWGRRVRRTLWMW